MVKSSLTAEQLKRAQEIYKIARSKDLAERRHYLSSLTEEEKRFYKLEDGKARSKKFNENPEHKKRYNEMRSKNIEEAREKEPEVFAEVNLKDVKAFREREKIKLQEIKQKMEVNTKIEATKQAKNLTDDICSKVINEIPIKRKPGRPRKQK